MINRRGFLQLLSALGAAAALPAEAQAILAAPEPEMAPIDETAGEGFWWTPKGGKPMRLDVLSWEAGQERDYFDVRFDYLDVPPTKRLRQIYHYVRVNTYAGTDLLKSIEMMQDGKLTAHVKGLGRIEFPEVMIRESTVHFGPTSLPRFEIDFASNGPAILHES